MKVNNLILGLLIADNSTMWGREQNRRVEVYMQASEKMLQEVENEGKFQQQEVNL